MLLTQTNKQTDIKKTHTNTTENIISLAEIIIRRCSWVANNIVQSNKFMSWHEVNNCFNL